jgi:hypothetical protein
LQCAAFQQAGAANQVKGLRDATRGAAQRLQWGPLRAEKRDGLARLDTRRAGSAVVAGSTGAVAGETREGARGGGDRGSVGSGWAGVVVCRREAAVSSE